MQHAMYWIKVTTMYIKLFAKLSLKSSKMNTDFSDFYLMRFKSSGNLIFSFIEKLGKLNKVAE